MKLFSLIFVYIFCLANAKTFHHKFRDPISFVKSKTVGSQKYTWKIEWFTVPIDHFSFGNPKEFNIKYLINLDNYKPGGPIFFYTGNEGRIEGFATNTGLMWDIAPQFSAALVFAEHRYYGESMPFQNHTFDSVENMGYLSSEQALADFAVLIRYLKSERIPGSQNSPVVAFGGSYGGMLAAWFRLKYPHVVNGSIAASAPIRWFPNVTGVSPSVYDKITTRTFLRSGCNFDALVAGFEAIKQLASTSEGRTRLNTVFKLDSSSRINSSADGQLLVSYVQDVMENVVMIDYPYPASFLVPLPGWPVKEMCKTLNKPPNKKNYVRNAAAMYNILNVYYNSSGELKEMSLNQNPDSELGDITGWSWQSCTEMAMVMCSKGPPSEVFPPTCPNTVDSYAAKCYDSLQAKGYVKSLFRPNWITTNYGTEFDQTSNIVFSNGRLDPWSGGGWRQENVREGSLISIILQEGAHHYDLRSSNPADTEEVKKVRLIEIEEIKKWIQG